MDIINNNPGKDNEDIGPLGNALLSHLQEYYNPNYIKEFKVNFTENKEQTDIQ